MRDKAELRAVVLASLSASIDKSFLWSEDLQALSSCKQEFVGIYQLKNKVMIWKQCEFIKMRHFARAIKEGKVWWADFWQLPVFLPIRTGREKGKSESHGLRQRQGGSLPTATPGRVGSMGCREITAPKKGNKFKILLLQYLLDQHLSCWNDLEKFSL